MAIQKWFFAGALLLSSSTFAESLIIPDDLSPRFCIQNFNAYGPVYASSIEERMERMSSALQAIPKCEVVHLQEVWSESQINQVESNLRHQYQISTPNRAARIGVMSLLMSKIKGTETHFFNVNNEGGVLDSVRETFNVKKAFHVVRTNFLGSDEDFYLMNTHLHPTSRAVRLTQILDLLTWRRQNQDLKLVLSGDFNADPGSLERAMVLDLLGARDAMEDYMGGYPQSGFCTYCRDNPLGWLPKDHVFDYVFYANSSRSSSSLTVTQAKVNLQGTTKSPLSDHYGVRVDFRLSPETISLNKLTLDQRRRRTLMLLFQVEEIFSQQEEPEFLPYLMQVRELRKQLLAQQGRFYDYFAGYR